MEEGEARLKIFGQNKLEEKTVCSIETSSLPTEFPLVYESKSNHAHLKIKIYLGTHF